MFCQMLIQNMTGGCGFYIHIYVYIYTHNHTQICMCVWGELSYSLLLFVFSLLIPLEIVPWEVMDIMISWGLSWYHWDFAGFKDDFSFGFPDVSLVGFIYGTALFSVATYRVPLSPLCDSCPFVKEYFWTVHNSEIFRSSIKFESGC